MNISSNKPATQKHLTVLGYCLIALAIISLQGCVTNVRHSDDYPDVTDDYEYYYYPQQHVYYDIHRHVYHYRHADRGWISVIRLPSHIKLTERRHQNFKYSHNRPWKKQYQRKQLDKLKAVNKQRGTLHLKARSDGNNKQHTPLHMKKKYGGNIKSRHVGPDKDHVAKVVKKRKPKVNKQHRENKKSRQLAKSSKADGAKKRDRKYRNEHDKKTNERHVRDEGTSLRKSFSGKAGRVKHHANPEYAESH